MNGQNVCSSEMHRSNTFFGTFPYSFDMYRVKCIFWNLPFDILCKDLCIFHYSLIHCHSSIWRHSVILDHHQGELMFWISPSVPFVWIYAQIQYCFPSKSCPWIYIKRVQLIGNLKWQGGYCFCSQDDRVERLNANGILGDCNICAR